VGIPAGPIFLSPSATDADPERGGRVATTERFRLSSGGRTPRVAVGTKLAGVAAIWGAV